MWPKPPKVLWALPSGPLAHFAAGLLGGEAEGPSSDIMASWTPRNLPRNKPS